MCEVIIRRASADDVDDIVYIEVNCFKTPRTAAIAAHGIGGRGCFCYVAEKMGKIIGYIAASIVIDEFCIERVAVLPEARSCGIGGRLLSAAMEEGISMGAAMMYLEVRETNAHAIAMYTSAGFEKVGIRKNYYGIGEHAFVMVKNKILQK